MYPEFALDETLGGYFAKIEIKKAKVIRPQGECDPSADDQKHADCDEQVSIHAPERYIEKGVR